MITEEQKATLRTHAEEVGKQLNQKQKDFCYDLAVLSNELASLYNLTSNEFIQCMSSLANGATFCREILDNTVSKAI
jgi:hypothetical protein